jgi:hypothetical protein
VASILIAMSMLPKWFVFLAIAFGVFVAWNKLQA